jgi:hypothetical protein
MSMNNPTRTLVDVPQRRFRDVAPSTAAEAERRWFFNEAEAEIDTPSNFCGLIVGVSPTSAEAVERRMDARHAAGKINDWLKRLSTTQALLLGGLYTERPWSEEVTKGRRDLVNAWRAELELACALAVHAYDRARGNRPCVVPQDEGEA